MTRFMRWHATKLVTAKVSKDYTNVISENNQATRNLGPQDYTTADHEVVCI